jgi:hypothetical protein
MDTPSKVCNVLCDMIQYAKNSPLPMQHCAIVMYKGKPVSWSYNDVSGVRTMHAEYSAICKYLRDRGFLGVVKEQRFLWGCVDTDSKGADQSAELGVEPRQSFRCAGYQQCKKEQRFEGASWVEASY